MPCPAAGTTPRPRAPHHPILPLPCRALAHGPALSAGEESPPMSVVPCVALVPYLGSDDEGATAWARLAPAERRRTAMQAACDHDRATLWSLTEPGMRAAECADPCGADVHLARRELVVRRGKGGKQRGVALSATLRQALAALARRADSYVLLYRTAASAWRHMQALCQAAEVTAKG